MFQILKRVNLHVPSSWTKSTYILNWWAYTAGGEVAPMWRRARPVEWKQPPLTQHQGKRVFEKCVNLLKNLPDLSLYLNGI